MSKFLNGMINRRDFLKRVALAAAGLPLASGLRAVPAKWHGRSRLFLEKIRLLLTLMPPRFSI